MAEHKCKQKGYQRGDSEYHRALLSQLDKGKEMISTGINQFQIENKLNPEESQDFQSQQELEKISKKNKHMSKYIKNIVRMSLIRHYGYWDRNTWKFKKNEPVHRIFIERFIKKTWPLTKNHWQRVSALLPCYIFQFPNGQIILKNPSNRLFAKWWNDVHSSWKPNFLNIWMKKSKIGLQRRKKVCPETHKDITKIRRLRTRLKRGSQKLRDSTRIRAYQRFEKIERINYQYKYEQIFKTIPPKTHAKDYHQLRQAYVNHSMYEKILDALSGSSLFKRYMFLQRGGKTPESSKWGEPTFYKDYLFIPHFIVDEQEEEINEMIQRETSERIGQTKQGSQLYVSDSQYWMIKQWRSEIEKVGIIYTDYQLEEAYWNTIYQHLFDVEINQLKEMKEKRREDELLVHQSVKKRYTASWLFDGMSKKDKLDFVEKIINSVEVDKIQNAERDRLFISRAYLNRQRRIQAYESMPYFGRPRKTKQQLHQRADELKEDWRVALLPERHAERQMRNQYAVSICSRCDRHLLEIPGEVWECSHCQGLFHSKCWHPFECEAVRTAWVNSFYPLDLPPQINLLNFSKSRNILNIRSYTKEQKLWMEQNNKLNESIIKQRGIPTRRNVYYRGYKFYPCMNEDLSIIAESDWKILQKWYGYEYHSPISIQEMGDNKGKGVRAIMPIKKNEFICEYAGDVYPRSFRKNEKDKEYIFQLSYGPKSSQDFEICPKKHWSVANYLNHSPQKKANVISVALLTQNGVVILLRAKKRIELGQELTYCYNGRQQNYDTKGFQ